MTRHGYQAQRESLPETPTRDQDLSSYPQGNREATYISFDHDQPAQDVSQTPSDPPMGPAQSEEYQMLEQERGQRKDIPSEGKEEVANSDQGSTPVSLQGRSLTSSEFLQGLGQTFQTRLGDLLKDTPQDHGASTQSDRARSWDRFVLEEDRLRNLRMRADKVRQKALMKRREMKFRLISFTKVLAPTREQTPELLALQLLQHSKQLEENLLELAGIEEELEGPEVEIVIAEWNLSHLAPRLLSSQNADETLRILVENEYHFPAVEQGSSDSIRSSLNFTEEPSRDAYAINSKLENVSAIEEKILHLQSQSLDVASVSGDVEPSSIPLPEEQLSELQRLKIDLQEATSDLEQSRDLLQPAPEDNEAVQGDLFNAVLYYQSSPFSTGPPGQQAEDNATSKSLRLEASPPLSPAQFLKYGNFASGKSI